MANMLFTIVNRLYRYTLLTFMTYIGVVNFMVQLSLFPIYFILPTLYRKMTTIVLNLSIPGFLCVPFSWARCRMYSNGLHRLGDRAFKDQLMLTNHSGRVDWLFGMFIGNYYRQRVGFITEAFLMWLPFVGWARYLVEDMFVFRSFKRDKERLLGNITAFKKSGVKRWVYLCPEGHIADFNPRDQQYIEDCGKFCKDNGLEPFKMVLTPRYKGMQIFTKICPKNEKGESIVQQCTATYVLDGERLVKPLRSKNRVIPDLWNAVTGDIECYVKCHSFGLSDDPKKMKQQLLNDYAMQDKCLYEFYKTGRYPVGHPEKPIEETPDNWKPMPFPNVPFLSQAELDRKCGVSPELQKKTKNVDSDYQELPKNHLAMNASFFGQVLGSFWVMSKLGLGAFILPMLAGLYFALAFSHMLGEVLADGQSRESLPFEGVVKAIMFRFYGVEGGEKKKPETGTVQ